MPTEIQKNIGKQFKGIWKTRHNLHKKFNRDQKENVELKNIMNTMKNTNESINIRLDQTEESVK